MREHSFRAFLVGLMALAPVLGGADGGCSNDVPIGQDPPRGDGGQSVRCGDTTCGAGEVCCNPSCGICTPPGGACTTQICEGPSCTDTMNGIRRLIVAHRACEADADCTTVNVSCLPSSNCTGNLFVNRDLDQQTLAELTRELNTCVNGDPDIGCPVCLRLDPPPACIDNVCQPASELPPGPGPCAGKACGETCSNCVDGQPCRAIGETCDANGQCGGPVPCRAPTDPCAGKACGDTCSNCVDGQPCRAVLEFCDANGQCGGPVSCRAPTDPCAGKACGDECSTCVPGKPCLAIQQFCDAKGVCSSSYPPACR